MKIPNSCAKRDCFAYNGGYFAHDGGCAALKKMVCNAEDKCPFYKSKREEKKDDLFSKASV